MQLQNIHIAGVQVFQAGVQIVPEIFGCLGRGLGSQELTFFFLLVYAKAG